jgi:hypothetical protein
MFIILWLSSWSSILILHIIKDWVIFNYLCWSHIYNVKLDWTDFVWSYLFWVFEDFNKVAWTHELSVAWVSWFAVLFKYRFQFRLLRVNYRTQFILVIRVRIKIKDRVLRNSWLFICKLLILICIMNYLIYYHILSLVFSVVPINLSNDL